MRRTDRCEGVCVTDSALVRQEVDFNAQFWDGSIRIFVVSLICQDENHSIVDVGPVLRISVPGYELLPRAGLSSLYKEYCDLIGVKR